jgi:CDP-6-deoxy-D-xylo-4-hexulose-3-dehydrase
MTDKAKNEIFALVRKYYEDFHKPVKFVPGQTKVHYAGRVYDGEELTRAVDAALDFQLTAGRYAAELERSLKEFFGASSALLVNSGSSANLLIAATLASPDTAHHLKPGDEVVTPAVTFPTTLAPFLMQGLVPVFVDSEIGTYNMDPAEVERAIGPNTRAILAPHTLGNPCHLSRYQKICREKGLFLIEDCCDALGGLYEGKKVGSFGSMASLSFYPAHHMTLGEGGGVIVNDAVLAKTALSLRDWGRDCWCIPGASDTCGKRFGWQLGQLPAGYDHKYIYSHVGYNLKLTDMQAAIGTAQWKKLPDFLRRRRENFNYYLEKLKRFEEYLTLPVQDPKAQPAWFGFPVTVRKGVERAKLVRFLEDAKIETRMIFAGNILRQPGFQGIAHRVAGSLTRSDEIMNNTFFIGIYPGLTAEMRDYVVSQFEAFFKGKK